MRRRMQQAGASPRAGQAELSPISNIGKITKNQLSHKHTHRCTKLLKIMSSSLIY